MNKTRWRQIEELFHVAQLLTTDARISFLEKACREDEELKAELLSLLAAAETEDDFLAKPVRRMGFALLASRESYTDEEEILEQRLAAGFSDTNHHDTVSRNKL